MTPHGAIFGMRLRRARNHLVNLKRDSAAKVFVVLFGLGNVVAICLWISYKSFAFIDGFVFGQGLNSKLIGLLFFSLFVLITLSTIIISYTTLFIARETEFLFQYPVPPRTVLFLKMGEAVSFSGWASLFLCLPVLVSFGLLRDAPLAYYAQATVVLVTFLALAGCAGTLITLILTPLMKRLGPRKLLVGGIAALALLAWLFLRSFQFWALDGENNLLVLDRFMSGLRTMQAPYSPSRWASDAILAASGGNHPEVLFQWGLLLANTLIFIPPLSLYGNRRFGREWVSRRSFRPAEIDRERRRHTIQRVLCRSPISALVLKDVLVFVRNPAQLSQSLLFLLLMVIYSLSLMRIPEYISGSRLELFVHFANIGAVSLILSSFTSRFLFPLLSLEGRAFWTLGLAPMPRTYLLRQKAVFGLVISLGLGLTTMVVSNLALETPPDRFVGAVYTIILASTCLTCLSTGLGAAYPSFDEDNPARIAAGLGGTLNFFASALVIGAIVLIEAMPYIVSHFRMLPETPVWSILSSHVLAFALAAAVCMFALELGGRALSRQEF